MDEHTCWTGADLTGATHDPGLAQWLGQPASLDPAAVPRAELDATVAILRDRGRDDLAGRVAALRSRVVDASSDWFAELAPSLTPADRSILEDAARDGVASATDLM